MKTANQVLRNWYIKQNPDKREAIRHRMQFLLKVTRQTVWNYLNEKTPLPEQSMEKIEADFGISIFSDAGLLVDYRIIEMPAAIKIEFGSAAIGCPLADHLEAAGINTLQVIVHREINQSTIILQKMEIDRLKDIIQDFYTKNPPN